VPTDFLWRSSDASIEAREDSDVVEGDWIGVSEGEADDELVVEVEDEEGALSTAVTGLRCRAPTDVLREIADMSEDAICSLVRRYEVEEEYWIWSFERLGTLIPNSTGRTEQ
jgi:hypothetical protein